MQLARRDVHRPHLGLRGRIALAVWVATALALLVAGQFSVSYLTARQGYYSPEANSLRLALWVVGVVAATLAAFAAWLVAGLIARPVRRAGVVAARFGAGDTGARIRVRGRDDVAQMSAQFNQMADSVVRTMEAQRHFISDTAHELRTPTAALVATASALENPATRDEAAVMVAPQLRRLSELTEDLLALARFDSAREVLRTEVVDLVGLCQASVRAVGQPGEVQVLVVGQRPVEVACDAVRIQTIVRNLAANGLKHGAAPVTVLVAATPHGASVTVVDEGPGVGLEGTDKLFDRFVRGDRARHGTGSGLGLAIARENARLHGGELSVDEGGHAFRLTLPAEAATPAPVVEAAALHGRARATRWVLALLLVGTGLALACFCTLVGLLPGIRPFHPEGQPLVATLLGATGVYLTALLLWWGLSTAARALQVWWAAPLAALVPLFAAGVSISAFDYWIPVLVALPVALLLVVDRWVP